MLNPDDTYCFALLCLVVWREARGEVFDAKRGVAWSIRNRVQKPGWWGKGWDGVILHPFQYSSFNTGDANATLVPMLNSISFPDCQAAAMEAWGAVTRDITGGATHYFDKSLDGHPPGWATDGSMVHTVDLGALHFYRKV
jgi:N-acetylmuramoyl-L-alanine amidase